MVSFGGTPFSGAYSGTCPPGTRCYNRPTTGGNGLGLTVDILNTQFNGTLLTSDIAINNPGTGYLDGDVLVIDGKYGDATMTLEVEIVSTMQDVVSEYLPDGITPNPLRQPYGSGASTWQGDPEYLKDKFVRFSYRFKFDDDEYSLIAPFTQECFVPQQDGYFIGDDEDRSFKSTEVDFVQNKVDNIILQIPSPSCNTRDQVE